MPLNQIRLCLRPLRWLKLASKLGRTIVLAEAASESVWRATDDLCKRDDLEIDEEATITQRG